MHLLEPHQHLLNSRRKLRRRRIVAVPGVIAAVGIVAVLITFAAGTPIAFEPETGTLAGGATITSVTGQSGSGAVKFAAASTPTPSPGANVCPPYPATPDANCTGPTGSLPLWTGGDEFRADGQVVENVEIRTSDGLYVPADNVTFRNVKIVYTGAVDESFTVVNLNYNSGTLFEDCEIAGGGKVARGITGSGVTVRNCEIHGVGNAIETESPLVVEENYIHHICTPDGLDWHADGIQTPMSTDNIRIVHNAILLCGPETGAINIMGNAGDPATNVLVEHNLFAGGGYTLYAGYGANYRVINNRLSTQVYPKVGFYNIWYWNPEDDGDVLRTGNVIHETGAAANDNL